jgi:hypothetical protein
MPSNDKRLKKLLNKAAEPWDPGYEERMSKLLNAKAAEIKKKYPQDTREQRIERLIAWGRKNKSVNDYFASKGAMLAIQEFLENATKMVDGMLVPAYLQWQCPVCKEKTSVVQEVEYFPRTPNPCPCGRAMVRLTKLTTEQEKVLRAHKDKAS